MADNTHISRARTAVDVAIVMLAVAAVIGIRSAAPSNTYAYAQLWQVGVAIDVGENGNWLTPHDQKGAPARKPQLLPWLTGPTLKLLGVYNDFTFRLPSIAAALLTGALIYSLGRRWANRRVGLLAGCLWATAMHMGRLSYLATTDMLLTLWMTVAVACVDRVLWHKAAPGRRGLWLTGFYAAMILAALSKGWGVVNWPVLALMIALAAAFQPGFGRIARRWWHDIKAIHLWWGMLAFAIVLGGLMVAMNAAAGNDLSEVLGFEVVQRITGGGDSPPRPTSVPPILQMIYFTLPMSILAIGALVLERPAKWLTGQSVITLPLCWIAAVVVPFSLAHGFRPDYLLPCYGAVAIMAAWAVDRVAQLGARGGRLAGALRHTFAAAPVVIAASLIVMPLLYLLGDRLPAWMQLDQPYRASSVDRAVLTAMIPAGAAMLAAAVALSLKWKVRQFVLLACAGMAGVIFIEGNFISRHARTGDGDKMADFARDVRDAIGEDEFLVLMGEKLTVELHLGRFGEVVVDSTAEARLARINRAAQRWLITCDRGLVEIGASLESADGLYHIKINGVKHRFDTRPGELGEVVAEGEEAYSNNWGRPYLIDLRDSRPVSVDGLPTTTGYVTGDWDSED